MAVPFSAVDLLQALSAGLLVGSAYLVKGVEEQDRIDINGPAKELLLATVRRRTAAEVGVEVFGDTAVWDSWLDHTPF